MESHYKDSLSTAIVNILLQCGFENSSKRALDEFVGLSLNYIRNISSRISSLTSDCNMLESDILIGLGALKLHGDNLDELFNFLHNYNEIFPPQPKVYFGPIPVKHAQRPHEERPLDIVPWAPEMSPALATIGLKLKNNQIVSDPNFDRSKFLALSFKPLSNTNDSKSQNSQSQSQTMTNSSVKYGSSCSYQLPAEAYPNKYEPPTIDLDSNGAVIGLNGKSGKLPDPYINDLEEQDIMRQKSKFNENHSTKMTFHNQLFNGVRRKPRATAIVDEPPPHNSPQIKKKVRQESPPIVDHYKSNHVDKSVTSDDAWNAALQATVITIVKPDPYALIIDSPDTSVLKPLTPIVKKHKKRHRSPSQQRVKKKRRIEHEERENNISHMYQNESTMDSRLSEDHVPYLSSPEHHSGYSYLSMPPPVSPPLPSSLYPDHQHHYHQPHHHYQSNQPKERSPSYSPINEHISNFTPQHIHSAAQFSYSAEIIPSQTFLPTSKSKKKKPTRKTHFTNKRKKKPLAPVTVTTAPYNYQYKRATIDDDNYSEVVMKPVSVMHGYEDRSQTPSPAMSVTVSESDDDGTEPMRESSEEMLRMLEMADSNHNEMADSPLPYSLLNNKHNHAQENSSEGGGGIRMRIKLCKTNSDTNRAGSYVNSIADLSSPPQSQHSDDDKNSISERLNFMRDQSPVSVSSSSLSRGRRLYEQQHQRLMVSPSVSSTHESSYHRSMNSVSVSASAAMTATNIITTASSGTSLRVARHTSASSHSSPKTLPALDDCDNKIPSISLKSAAITAASATVTTIKSAAKKRKRSRLNSSSKKSKSKKASKQKVELEEIIVTKPPEKNFISVDDVFSDEDDPVKGDLVNHHHYNQYLSAPSLAAAPVIAQVSPPSPPLSHHHHKSPSIYRSPIPIMKINNRSLSKKSASSRKSASSKSTVLVLPLPPQPSPVLVRPSVETKMMYNYSCKQGEAHYQSEDGKVVYICPICNTEDNGSLMLLCDLCEDWYHGLCLGIFDEPPEHVEWYCPRCIEDRISGRSNSSKTKSSKNRTKKK